MVLSKPVNQTILDFINYYLRQLQINPLKTKSITSLIIVSLGNLTSQLVASGANLKHFNKDSLAAFALFGFLFSGPLPHFFYTGMERLYPSSSFGSMLKFLTERLIFAPFYQAFSLYTLSRFEWKNHKEALSILDKLYWPVLKANWQYWTLLQFINLTFVPPLFRVLFVNIVGFFWAIFLALKKRQAEENRKTKSS